MYNDEIYNYGHITIKLGEVLIERKLSKNKFCHMAQMQHTQLNSYCNNTIKTVDAKVLARICNALDCSINDVLEFVPNESQD